MVEGLSAFWCQLKFVPTTILAHRSPLVSVPIHIMSSSVYMLVLSRILLARTWELKELAATINIINYVLYNPLLYIITTILNRIIRTINYVWKLYRTYYERKTSMLLNTCSHVGILHVMSLLVYTLTRAIHTLSYNIWLL